MLVLARNSELRKEMGRQSYYKIKDNTPEKWAEDFEKIVFNLTGGVG